MRKRRVYLAGIAVAVLVGLLVALSLRSREPEYGGKRLSEWVDTIWKPMPSDTPDERSYNIPRFDETPIAIRTMGTNALPYLLKWTQYEPGLFRSKLAPALNPWLARLNPKWQLLQKDSPAYYRSLAARYALFMLLSDPNPQTRSLTTNALGHIDPHLALFRFPGLVDCLQDKNPGVVSDASNVLQQIDPKMPENARKKDD